MTDSEKATLEARIDELCAENEKLRERLKESDDGRMRQADNLIDKYHKIARLQTENAKLREQLHITGTYCVNGYCEPDDGCPLLVDRKCQLTDRMREVGVDE